MGLFSTWVLGKSFEDPVQKKLPSPSVIVSVQSPPVYLESVVFHLNGKPTAAALFVSTGGFEVDAILITDREKSWTPIPEARSSTNTGLALGRNFSEQNTEGL